jgi:hypothetical protein
MKGFPDSPGLYIAQRKTDVVLIKITGQYPLLKLGKGINVAKLINGNKVVEVDKEVLSNIVCFSKEWDFNLLPVDSTAFPENVFRADGIISIDPETRSSIRNNYFRMLQMGTPISDVLRAESYEYNITMEQMRQLANEFDKDAN